MGWNIIRGNHARQPRSSSPKRREFSLFVLKIKLLFFSKSNFSKVFQDILNIFICTVTYIPMFFVICCNLCIFIPNNIFLLLLFHRLNIMVPRTCAFQGIPTF